MINELIFGSFFQLCIFYSSLSLLIGLAASQVLRRHSAHAHQALLLFMAAAVLIPCLHRTVKVLHWGLFVADSIPAKAPVDLIGDEISDFSVLPILGNKDQTPQLFESLAPAAIPPRIHTPIHFLAYWPWLWLLISSVLLIRLAVALIKTSFKIRHTHPLPHSILRTALEHAREKLHIQNPAAIYSHKDIRIPSVWCWRRHAVLLVPDPIKACLDASDWEGIICHELAHYKRRDHINGLLSELVLCVIPWHPLVWFAKQRLTLLSEQACDDWVLVSGYRESDYAESLLDLAPQSQFSFAPCAVTSKKGLATRVRRILEERPASPHIGHAWALCVGILGAVLIAGTSLAQTRPAASRKANGGLMYQRHRGTVTDPNNQSAANVNIASVSCNENPQEEPGQIENPLIGTWKLVSAKHRGRESDLPERYTIHKHITPTHYLWVHVDPTTQKIVMSIGGTYSFTEKTYTEQALYGFGNWYPSNRNRTNTLSCRVEENKWYHGGRLANGAVIEEVWERVFLASSNEISKEEPEPIENPLIGTWKLLSAKKRGRESDLAERYAIHKHVTPTHSIWVHIDPTTEEIVRSIGGTYSFTETTLTTQTLYGYGNWYPSNRNRTNTLSCRVEDNKWYHGGRLANGAMIEEIWERAFLVSSNEISKEEPELVENPLITKRQAIDAIRPSNVGSHPAQPLNRGPRAVRPQPHDGSLRINWGVSTLEWTAGVGAKVHNIFFGTDSNDLVHLGQVKEAKTSLSGLVPGSTYFWRVDETLGDGSVAEGPVWRFSTGELLAWWKFDETAGRVVSDASGRANHGVLQGNPRWGPDAGIISGAMEFDGGRGYVDCGDKPDFDLAHTISVTAWIKVDVFDKRHQTIIAKGDRTWRLYRLQETDALAFACAPKYKCLVQGTVSVNDGLWHHIVGTYDGRAISLYVDGKLDRRKSARGAIPTDDKPVCIGENVEYGERVWNGLIDDVRIYDTALLDSQIKAMYEEHEGRARMRDTEFDSSHYEVEMSR